MSQISPRKRPLDLPQEETSIKCAKICEQKIAKVSKSKGFYGLPKWLLEQGILNFLSNREFLAFNLTCKEWNIQGSFYYQTRKLEAQANRINNIYAQVWEGWEESVGEFVFNNSISKNEFIQSTLNAFYGKTVEVVQNKYSLIDSKSAILNKLYVTEFLKVHRIIFELKANAPNDCSQIIHKIDEVAYFCRGYCPKTRKDYTEFFKLLTSSQRKKVKQFIQKELRKITEYYEDSTPRVIEDDNFAKLDEALDIGFLYHDFSEATQMKTESTLNVTLLQIFIAYTREDYTICDVEKASKNLERLTKQFASTNFVKGIETLQRFWERSLSSF